MYDYIQISWILHKCGTRNNALSKYIELNSFQNSIFICIYGCKLAFFYCIEAEFYPIRGVLFEHRPRDLLIRINMRGEVMKNTWSPHSRFPCSSAHTRLRRCTQGGANPWADSCEGWIRCRLKLSAWRNHPGTWLCVHILMLVCFFTKGIGWGGVLGWHGFD